MKLLGGKNGNLRCSCGQLRYPNESFCANCAENNRKLSDKIMTIIILLALSIAVLYGIFTGNWEGVLRWLS